MVEPAAFPHAAALSGAGLEIEADPEAGEGGCCVVSGNTYQHKDILKAHGGRWSKSRSAWVFDDPAMLDRLGQAIGGHGSASDALGFAEAPALFDAKELNSAKSTKAAAAAPHYHGHRQRLRERFRESDGEGMPDYELLELLLFFSIRYIDVKPLAKRLLEEFGSLGGVLAAAPKRLEAAMFADDLEKADRIRTDCDFTITHLKAMQRMLQRVLAEDVKARPVISSWQALLDYLKVALGHEPIEQFRVLFLDKKNILIRDEVQQRGTVDHTPLYPREIAKRALELGASAIIMVHNHPSGDPTPSRADIEMTKQVEAALAPIRVALHDHLIIGKDRHLSFKSEGLI
ncbi:MAG: DNA repair protein RadC [Alphaproteobacteria bacterium]|nr:DNA repair protein RadC [Alphaproteobacteria bacterium]